LSFAVFDEDAFDAVAVVDAFALGLEVAACAIAVPPTTRAPEIITAITACLIRCDMSFTSFYWWSVHTSEGGASEGSA
jgi:hypothetical protein